jgi:hypothetical protein
VKGEGCGGGRDGDVRVLCYVFVVVVLVVVVSDWCVSGIDRYRWGNPGDTG